MNNEPKTPAPEPAAPLVTEAHEDDARLSEATWSTSDGRISKADLTGVPEGITRARNNLRATPDQLAIARAEAERLRALVPTCTHCEQRPATCFGSYEGGEPGDEPAPACERCCGHGNEDGWCVPIADLPGWAATVNLNADILVEERDAFQAMVIDLLASAYPHPVEHPTMSAAWGRAQALLQKYPRNGDAAHGDSEEAREAALQRRLPPRKEWDAARHNLSNTAEADGYESADYVNGWNAALDAVLANNSARMNTPEQ